MFVNYFLIFAEEEWKRYYLSLQEGFQAVGFSYDEQSTGGGQSSVAQNLKGEEMLSQLVVTKLSE